MAISEASVLLIKSKAVEPTFKLLIHATVSHSKDGSDPIKSKSIFQCVFSKMPPKFQESVKKLIKRCYLGAGASRDRNYTIIAPPVKRRKIQRDGGGIEIRRSSSASPCRCRISTRFVVGCLLLGICVLTFVLIFCTSEFILRSSEPLVITEYNDVKELEFRRTTNVYDKNDDEDPTRPAIQKQGEDEDQDVEEDINENVPMMSQMNDLPPNSSINDPNAPPTNDKLEHETADYAQNDTGLEPKEDFQVQHEEFQPIAVENERGACQLPKLNPFDASILEFVDLEPSGELDCTFRYNRPVIFTTDFGSNLIMLENPEDYKLHKCCYTPFGRQDEEEVVILDVCFPMEDKVTSIPPEYEFIIVNCGLPGNSTKKYPVDMFSFVHEDSDRLALSPHAALYSRLKPAQPLNVVMIGIDAVSHMNFIRTMPQTYSFLRNVSAIGMNGYTKVGDNTFPNVAPILTGLNISELEGDDGCWRGEFFDDCPFIWKNYSQAGYVTSYAEDEQWMAAFNYGKAGFWEQPTDFYLRPFMMALGDRLGHITTGNANLCYGPRLAFNVLLDHVQKLAVTMARPAVQRNYFTFMWTNSLGHDELDTPKFGDADLVSVLRWFEDSEGDINQDDTILILLSDHGMRWGEIRTTFQGRIEERMPFLYFVFPPWFKERYSIAMKNMEANSVRLTTPFDLHETLLDLVDAEKFISNDAIPQHRHAGLNSDIQIQKPLPRGISLFAPVPLSRTCADASIEGHWCVCHSMQPIPDPAGDGRVLNAVSAIMATLNEMLAKYPQCSQLELTAVLNAQELVHPELRNLDEEEEEASNSASEPPPLGDDYEPVPESEQKERDADETIRAHLNSKNSNSAPSTETGDECADEESVPVRPASKLTVTFKTSPSEAIFEASVIEALSAPGSGSMWTLSGDISRVNLYRDQSRCVDEYSMKKYCYCP